MEEVKETQIDLGNGEICYLIEQFHKKSPTKINEIHNSSFVIKSHKSPFCTVTIILSNESEYIGHISASIFEDKTASLIMSGIRNIELPASLEIYHEEINNHDVALLVSEKYRGRGMSKKLIYKMFQYLSLKGVDDVLVYGITEKIAWKTYLGTGAQRIDVKKAIYHNISRILNSNVFDDVLQENVFGRK